MSPDDVTAEPVAPLPAQPAEAQPVAAPSVEAHAVEGAPVPMARGPRVGVLTWAALALGGLVLGSLGALVQADRRVVGDRTVPWGLVLVVVVVAVCVRAASYLVGSRRGGALVAAGWAVATVVLAGQGPGGDVVLPSSTRTTWYLGATTLLALVAVVWPLPRGADRLAAERRDLMRRRRHDDGLEPETDPLDESA